MKLVLHRISMVVFGRPKGDRGSYIQSKEENIVPQVVFEILSPGNTPKEMRKKLQSYDDYGVEEYYVYDPDRINFTGSIRVGERLRTIEEVDGWVSPRLGIRFQLTPETLEIYRPDGEKISDSFMELNQAREQERQRADRERQRAEQAEQRADRERQRAEQAEQRADRERQRAEQAEQQLAQQERQLADRLAELLRERGIDPNEIL